MSVITEVLIRGRQEVLGDGSRGWMIHLMMEGKDRSQQVQAAPATRRGQEVDSPLKPSQETHTLMLSPYDSLWSSGFQNYQVVSVCCFKPRNLW